MSIDRPARWSRRLCTKERTFWKLASSSVRYSSAWSSTSTAALIRCTACCKTLADLPAAMDKAQYSNRQWNQHKITHSLIITCTPLCKSAFVSSHPIPESPPVTTAKLGVSASRANSTRAWIWSSLPMDWPVQMYFWSVFIRHSNTPRKYTLMNVGIQQAWAHDRCTRSMSCSCHIDEDDGVSVSRSGNSLSLSSSALLLWYRM